MAREPLDERDGPARLPGELCPVTGLLDRAAFLRRLDIELRRGRAVRLAVADLVRFRRLNEALGPEGGDRALALLGARAAAAGGLCGRIGDDEFAVVLSLGEDDDDAVTVLRAALEQPLKVDGCDIHPRFALGVAAAAAGERVRAPDLLRRAGLALQAGRDAGEGHAAAYHAMLEMGGPTRLALEADARAGLRRGEFEAWYQPVIRLADGGVAGFEVLARWRHPRRGLLPPDDFLPLLAEAGLTGELGGHMLREGAAALARWRAAGASGLFASVNVTSGELGRPTLAAEVASVFAEHGLAPGTLKLELTESEVMRDPEAAAAAMGALREAGAGLAIDDFGMGFSSLSYLARLPVSVLKIDRYFVHAMGASAPAEAIIRSVAALGAELKLDIVAEGVETPAQAAALQAIGCGFGQGYRFAPALPTAEADAFLAGRR